MKKPASFQMTITMVQASTVFGSPSQLWLAMPNIAPILSRSPICGV